MRNEESEWKLTCLECCSDYLHAFVSRREQLRTLMTQNESVGRLQASKAFDFVEFFGVKNDMELQFQLIYDDLKSNTAGKVRVYGMNYEREEGEGGQGERQNKRRRLKQVEKVFAAGRKLVDAWEEGIELVDDLEG
eukprot:TRINITY_DN386_c0_g2_i4.p3 TRINITY_DN386_c0_g2~~TRINITY_DN386_c0_g2_i4.p3  ORF type:complete len:136 (-),score=30.53 TRINITY_DN386_c0_g2_i4:292-699(-)